MGVQPDTGRSPGFRARACAPASRPDLLNTPPTLKRVKAPCARNRCQRSVGRGWGC